MAGFGNYGGFGGFGGSPSGLGQLPLGGAPMGNLPGGPQGPMTQSQALQNAPMGAPQTPPPGGMPQGYGQGMDAMMQQAGAQQGFGQQPIGSAPLGGPQGPMTQSQALQNAPMGAPQTPPPGGMPQGYGQGMDAMMQLYQRAMAQQGFGQPLPPAMPQAPNVQQTRMEDPRMQAMRNIQRRGGYNFQ